MYLIPERCALRIKPENTSFTSLPKIILLSIVSNAALRLL